MKLKSLITSGICVISLAFASLASAEDQVLCPSIDLIKQSAKSLVNVSLDSSKYIVSTGYPAFSVSNRGWLVGTVIDAKDSESALLKARSEVSNVYGQFNRQAMLLNKETYACVYMAPESKVIAFSSYSGNSNSGLSINLNINAR